MAHDYNLKKLETGYKGRFVIQDHKATSRHWDLRLEFPVSSLKDSLEPYYEKRVWKDKEGNPTIEPKPKFKDQSGTVLRSWAIPKHKLPKKDDPLLAMETEDHSIDYIDFEGKIPEGNYGAGKVDIYDEGTFEIAEMDYDSKYVIKFDGSKIKGYYALIKTKGDRFLWVKVQDIEEYEKKKSKLFNEKLIFNIIKEIQNA